MSANVASPLRTPPRKHVNFDERSMPPPAPLLLQSARDDPACNPNLPSMVSPLPSQDVPQSEPALPPLSTVRILVLHDQRRSAEPEEAIQRTGTANWEEESAPLQPPAFLPLAARSDGGTVYHVLGRGQAGKTTRELVTAAIEALPAESVAELELQHRGYTFSWQTLLRDLSPELLQVYPNVIGKQPEVRVV